jgi:Protein of unknown function (DUF4235)
VKFIFMPVSIVAGVLAGQISKKLFDFAWGAVKDEEAPRPKHRHIPYGELILALVIEGAIARVVRGFVDHGTRHGWARLTGAWPGEEEPEEE